MQTNDQLSSTSPKNIEPVHLPHKVCEFACPSVGLEDMYEQKTGSRLPDYIIMDLSMLGFMYIRQMKAPVPRLVFWGNGTGKVQHQFLADVMGYQWKFSEGLGFKTAFAEVLSFIDQGQSVILGLLDMYHLPYFEKIYHRFHIPQHYVLMVGYDLEKKLVYVLDNSRPDVLTLPIDDLKNAWDITNPGQGKKNTYAVVTYDPQPSNLETILRRGLKKRALWMLEPPVGFMGLPGMRKFCKDFFTWPETLDARQLKACLEHLAMFTCSKVPMPPARLMRHPDKNADPHQAVRDRFSTMLSHYAFELNEPTWSQAAEALQESGKQIGQLTDRVVEAVLGDKLALKAASELLPRILSSEEKAFTLLGK